MKTNTIINLGLLLVNVMTASAFAAPTTEVNSKLKGTVRLSNCSASFIALEGYLPTDFGMILTNGHCLAKGSLYGTYPGPGEVFFHEPSNEQEASLNTGNSENPTMQLHIQELLYGTMTDTDIGIYLVQETYQEIKNKANTKPFILGKNIRNSLPIGARIRMASSYWQNSDTCSLEKKILEVREGHWTWRPSMRLSSECKVDHGSSGSPLILDSTNIIVGIINTMYEDGTACEENNPCEVGPQGEIAVGNSSQPYGQFVDAVYTCINTKRVLDLSVAGCILPKPAQESKF